MLILLPVAVIAGGCGDRTVYGPGFTRTSYEKIRIGMPRDDVIKILGQPLRVEEYHYREKVLYMDETKPWRKGPVFLDQDKAEWFTLFVFDKEGRLESHDGRYLDHEMPVPGTSMKEVVARFGEPHRVTVDDREGAMLVYATQDPRHRRSNYWSIVVHIGADGRVARKSDQFVVD